MTVRMICALPGHSLIDIVSYVHFCVSNSGVSRLSDQGSMVAVLGGGNRPNRFCECAVGMRTTFYIVMRDVNMTTIIEKTHDTV